MDAIQRDAEERTNLVGTNRFEMLLFRLGTNEITDKQELFGINVLKVREIVTMPEITPIAGASEFAMGVVHLREQVIPVYDLPGIVKCKPASKPNLMLITEYARNTQAFTVESVDDIVRLDWDQVISAEASGNGHSLVTSIARIEDAQGDSRLAQVLDVEAILQLIMPEEESLKVEDQKVGPEIAVKPGTIVLVADDSYVARTVVEQTLEKLKVPFEMVKSGKEAWDRLNVLAENAASEGKTLQDKVSLMLTDLEMPEMDGFALTRNIRQDPRMATLPVLVHSSLSGTTNETHVRRVGANGYVAKFEAEELSNALRNALSGNL